MKKLKFAGVFTLMIIMLFSSYAMAVEAPGEEISNELASEFIVVEPIPLTLSWTLGESQETTVGTKSTFSVTATNNTGENISNVLYVIEILKDDGPVSASDFTCQAVAEGEAPISLGYDTAGDFFYFGPSGGFTFPCEPSTITTNFELTFHNPGSYSVKVYAVQLVIPV